MKDTVKIMTESAFGFDTEISSKNKQLFESMNMISEETRQLTGFTAEKVTVLNDGNNIYIEFANNLERFMQDSGYEFKEALESVMTCNKCMSTDANIILDESCIDNVDIDAMISIVGEDHIFRK